ncbi:MAG: nucleoside deaminase [Gammaproteobacteria bacterium]|jgi:tRNA(Arg) A34 adenosine deaminase TadA
MNAVTQARLRWLSRRLDACRNLENPRPDDAVGIQVCEEALAAAGEGNYGVGAVILDSDGSVIVRARNRVFEPGFRSDGHAEMLAVNRLETEFPEKTPREMTLFVTLEPCPMCLTRLKLAGIGRVRYLSPDPDGGMVSCRDNLPPIWRLLNPRQDFAPADVSASLQRLGKRIFQVNLRALRRRLVERVYSAE